MFCTIGRKCPRLSDSCCYIYVVENDRYTTKNLISTFYESLQSLQSGSNMGHNGVTWFWLHCIGDGRSSQNLLSKSRWNQWNKIMRSKGSYLTKASGITESSPRTNRIGNKDISVFLLQPLTNMSILTNIHHVNEGFENPLIHSHLLHCSLFPSHRHGHERVPWDKCLKKLLHQTNDANTCRNYDKTPYWENIKISLARTCWFLSSHSPLGQRMLLFSGVT